MKHDDDYEADEPFVVIERYSGSASSFLWGLAIGAAVAAWAPGLVL